MAALHIRTAFTGSADPVSRRITLLRVLLPLALLVAVLCLGAARPADAKEQVPFTGTFATSAVVTLCPPSVCVSVHGSGMATHLGRTEITRSHAVTNTFVPCPDVSGGTIRSFADTLTLTAADGDTIMMSGSGTACANGIDVVASGTYTVTGGTGRFSGASGTMTLGVVRFSPDPETTTLIGTISSPGSLK